jgi:hypothetical protein
MTLCEVLGNHASIVGYCPSAFSGEGTSTEGGSDFAKRVPADRRRRHIPASQKFYKRKLDPGAKRLGKSRLVNLRVLSIFSEFVYTSLVQNTEQRCLQKTNSPKTDQTHLRNWRYASQSRRLRSKTGYGVTRGPYQAFVCLDH